MIPHLVVVFTRELEIYLNDSHLIVSILWTKKDKQIFD